MVLSEPVAIILIVAITFVAIFAINNKAAIKIAALISTWFFRS